MARLGPFRRGDIGFLALITFSAGSILLLAILCKTGDCIMKRSSILLACAASAVALSGCAGVTAFNAALIPTLKPLDVSVHSDTSCGDIVAMAMGVGKFDAAGAVAMVQACEHRDMSRTLSVDPQAARKAIPGLLKPAGLVPAP